MTNYRRNFVPGGSYFFTVNLADRSSRLLTDHVDLLRKAFRYARRIWQRRYWEHTLRDERDFSRHVDYIHFNPVKHELVPRVEDWPYSSFHRMVRLGVYAKDWSGDVSESGASFGER